MEKCLWKLLLLLITEHAKINMKKFHVFKFHIDSLKLYWRVWEKTSIKKVTQEIEKFYDTKLDFIEGIK